MSLTGKKLEIIDTMDMLVIDKTTGKTIFSAVTTKAGIQAKTQAIDIFAGIGQNLITSLRSKKEITVSGSMAEFNLDYFASANGVELDKTSTQSIYFDAVSPVTTGTATIPTANKIFAVKQMDGSFMKIVPSAPTAADEVQIVYASGATLTFFTGYTGAQVLVTYSGAAPTGKDNLTVVFSGYAFPKNAEVLMKTVVYDADTEDIVADAAVHFHKVALSSDWNLEFSMGKAIETPVEMKVLLPTTINGAPNTNAEFGKLIVTER